ILYKKDTALRHAYMDIDNRWQRETVTDPPDGIGGELDLAIGPSNQLHIAYTERVQGPTAPSSVVKYAHGTFGAWTIETVEGIEDEGQYIALTTSGGEPVIAFYDATLKDAQATRRVSFNDWAEDDIAEAGDVGRFIATRPVQVGADNGDVAYFDA